MDENEGDDNVSMEPSWPPSSLRNLDEAPSSNLYSDIYGGVSNSLNLNESIVNSGTFSSFGFGALRNLPSSSDTSSFSTKMCSTRAAASMSNSAESGSSSSPLDLVSCTTSGNGASKSVLRDSQSQNSSLASYLKPSPAQPSSLICPALGNEAEVKSKNLQAGFSSSVLLPTSADALKGVGLTSCNLLPNSSPQSLLMQSASPLPEYLASFADLTNVRALEPSFSGTGAVPTFSLPYRCTVSRSSDSHPPSNVLGEGTTLSSNSSYPDIDRAVGEGSVADEPGSVITSLPQRDGVTMSFESSTAITTAERGNSEAGGFELEQEPPEEGELEDGEVSGGWESLEDDEIDNDAAILSDDNKHVGDELEDVEEEEEGIIEYRTDGLTPMAMRFGMDRRINETCAEGPTGSQPGEDHRKNNKRRKGKGAIARQRKRSRAEKLLKGSNERNTQVNVDVGLQRDDISKRSKNRTDFTDTDRKAGEKLQRSGGKSIEVDTGPEEGEVLEEDNRGLLSQLVEEEVGLWTTDVGDEQITSSKIDSDEDGKKKSRAPISAERKLKKKLAFRRKRAEKEKELGIRRPRMPVNTFKPKIPLCKFYLKGRCTLGAKCTFSHDVVPITKSDPCKFYMANRCLKGDDCPFSHNLDVFPCKFWHTRGHCFDGNNCRFSHGPLTEDQRQNLTKRMEHDNKEQQNIPELPTDLDMPEESDSDYMPTMNITAAEGLDRDFLNADVNFHDATGHGSTSIASQTLPNREVISETPERKGSRTPTSMSGETNKEEIQLAETDMDDTLAENAVLLAARKAASAAAVQAAASTNKMQFSRSSPSIYPLKSRSFGRLTPRGSESSAMDLLQASLDSDNRFEVSRYGNSNPVGNNRLFWSIAVANVTADTSCSGRSALSGPLSSTVSGLTRSGSLATTRQLAAQGSKASAMELLQASLGNDTTVVDNQHDGDFKVQKA